MMYDTLDIRRERQLLWVTLNRPERLNALSPRMIDELGVLFDRLADDHETGVVILRGAGRAFCAGWDLKEESQDGGLTGSVDVALRVQRRFSSVIMKMRRAPQPIVACVHGAATGGGFSVALAADVRMAGESARMNCAYIRVGLGGCFQSRIMDQFAQGILDRPAIRHPERRLQETLDVALQAYGISDRCGGKRALNIVSPNNVVGVVD